MSMSMRNDIEAIFGRLEEVAKEAPGFNLLNAGILRDVNNALNQVITEIDSTLVCHQEEITYADGLFWKSICDALNAVTDALECVEQGCEENCPYLNDTAE